MGSICIPKFDKNMIKRCGFSWRTPALKWKSKLVSYQSWTERPTSSPPTQWPAPALSQCLSAGTRRGAPNKWSCEGYDRSLSSPLATFCFEAKIVNWPSSLWNQRQPLLWKTVLITSGYGSNLPSTRLSIQWINMYANFRDHWTMANCSLSKLQICAFTVTTLLEAERLLEFHLKLASANGPRSIENLWRKATESVLLQDCKIWTQQITWEASQPIFSKKVTFGDSYLDQHTIYNATIYRIPIRSWNMHQWVKACREAIKSQDALFKRLISKCFRFFSNL